MLDEKQDWAVLDEIVAAHARRVHAGLRRHGVRNVITVDPHTTNMLRSIYPTLLEDWDITGRSYLEVLADTEPPATATATAPAAVGASRTIALHDSCVYARHGGIIEEPWRLLAGAGLEVLEPGKAGRLTWCCGGPAESLYPEKALATARKRVAQVRAVSTPCVTMCPLCLVNLTKAADGAVTFRDMSEVLLEARERRAASRAGDP